MLYHMQKKALNSSGIIPIANSPIMSFYQSYNKGLFYQQRLLKTRLMLGHG